MTNSEHMKNKDALDALEQMLGLFYTAPHPDMDYDPQELANGYAETIRAALSPETQGGEVLLALKDMPVSSNLSTTKYDIWHWFVANEGAIRAALQNNAQGDVEALWEDILENFDGHAESFSDVSLNILLYLQSKGHLRAIPEWMPIETAPKDGTRIDLYCKLENEYGGIKHKRMIDVQWGDLVDTLTGDLYQGWRMQYDAVWEITPTHWMPIPAAPKKGE